VLALYVACSAPFISTQLWATWDEHAHESPFAAGIQCHLSNPTTDLALPPISLQAHPPTHVFFPKHNIESTYPDIPWISKLSLSFTFPHHNPARISVLPLCTTSPAHRIFLDLTLGIIFDDEHISRSSSLCGLLLLNGKIMPENTQSPVETTLPGLSTYCHYIC
jgi:hypothetical protein